MSLFLSEFANIGGRRDTVPACREDLVGMRI